MIEHRKYTPGTNQNECRGKSIDLHSMLDTANKAARSNKTNIPVFYASIRDFFNKLVQNNIPNPGLLQIIDLIAIDDYVAIEIADFDLQDGPQTTVLQKPKGWRRLPDYEINPGQRKSRLSIMFSKNTIEITGEHLIWNVSGNYEGKWFNITEHRSDDGKPLTMDTMDLQIP